MTVSIENTVTMLSQWARFLKIFAKCVFRTFCGWVHRYWKYFRQILYSQILCIWEFREDIAIVHNDTCFVTWIVKMKSHRSNLYSEPSQTSNVKEKNMVPLDTGRKLNIHKRFRRRSGCLLSVLCTFNLRPVSRC